MDVLVIGNGFDLAHGLPTKYGDFIDFLYYCNKEWGKNSSYGKFKSILIDYSKKMGNKDTLIKEKVKKYVNLKESTTLNNFWVEHFWKRRDEIGQGWIDFEQEISNTLEKINFSENSFYKIFFEILDFYGIEVDANDKDFIEILEKSFVKNSEGNVLIYDHYEFRSIDDSEYINDINLRTLTTAKGCNIRWRNIYLKHIDDLVDNLTKDLENLIFAFEIYLKDFIEQIPADKNYDIEKIKNHIDKVISFNYDNTFKIIYDKHNNEDKVFHIHGKIRDEKEHRFNNMVLGIDEKLSDEIKNIDLKFVRFKKYFQRIYKHTGAEYRDWVNKKEILNSTDFAQEGKDYYKKDDFKIKYNTFYFFGHSLDASDKDILEEIICSENTKIKIFYTSRTQMDSQIINLIKIIGQENLIKYVYNENKKIEFLEQEYTSNYEVLKKLDLFETYKYILDLKFLENSNNFDDKKIYLLDQMVEKILPEKEYKMFYERILEDDDKLTDEELNSKCLEDIKKYNNRRKAIEELVFEVKQNSNNYNDDLLKYINKLVNIIDETLEDEFFIV